MTEALRPAEDVHGRIGKCKWAVSGAAATHTNVVELLLD
jgi:hypothetical protein